MFDHRLSRNVLNMDVDTVPKAYPAHIEYGSGVFWIQYSTLLPFLSVCEDITYTRHKSVLEVYRSFFRGGENILGHLILLHKCQRLGGRKVEC